VLVWRTYTPTPYIRFEKEKEEEDDDATDRCCATLEGNGHHLATKWPSGQWPSALAPPRPLASPDTPPNNRDPLIPPDTPPNNRDPLATPPTRPHHMLPQQPRAPQQPQATPLQTSWFSRQSTLKPRYNEPFYN
jgi:hypothetical protein